MKGSRSEIVGVQEHLDDAELHQFMNSKTQRLVDFSYLQFPIEGVAIGVIQIPLQERPIFLTDLGPVAVEVGRTESFVGFSSSVNL